MNASPISDASSNTLEKRDDTQKEMRDIINRIIPMDFDEGFIFHDKHRNEWVRVSQGYGEISLQVRSNNNKEIAFVVRHDDYKRLFQRLANGGFRNLGQEESHGTLTFRFTTDATESSSGAGSEKRGA
ncbi:hypothetical protein MMC09_003163 [Bachmanniomyces sp. S44760]|nr:hypothetical protein [Bachmanniomyces sp. S44760]